MTELTVPELIEQVKVLIWEPDQKRLSVLCQGITYHFKKYGYLSQKQTDTLRNVLRVYEERKKTQSGKIPDNYFAKTAERRKGYPRNTRPYQKTYNDE